MSWLLCFGRSEGSGAGTGGSGDGFGGSGAGTGGSGAGSAGGAARRRPCEDTSGDLALAISLQQSDDKKLCRMCKKNPICALFANESRVCAPCLVENPSDPRRRGGLTVADVDAVISDHFDHSAAGAARKGGAASARYNPYDRPGHRAAGKEPAHGGAAGEHASAHRPHSSHRLEPSIYDLAAGRTVHLWVTNQATGKVLILNNTKKRTWDFPGGQSNPGETVWRAGKREFDEELQGSGTKPQYKEGRDAMKAKKHQMSATLEYMLRTGAVPARVLHSGKHSVNIALVFKCLDDVEFLTLLGLPNLEKETHVKAYQTYMSNEHRGWLLVPHGDLRYADEKEHPVHRLNFGDKKLRVFVHDTPVFVELTNRKMMDAKLSNALHNFLVEVDESRGG